MTEDDQLRPSKQPTAAPFISAQVSPLGRRAAPQRFFGAATLPHPLREPFSRDTPCKEPTTQGKKGRACSGVEGGGQGRLMCRRRGETVVGAETEKELRNPLKSFRAPALFHVP